MSIRYLVENRDSLSVKEITLALVNEFGFKEKANWEAVIPANLQKDIFGGEILRLFYEHENFAGHKEIRAILKETGQTSQILVIFTKLNDKKLTKNLIERITKRFIGGQAAERYVVWFFGNEDDTEFKIVLSGKEGKKFVLKSLTFGVYQPYYKTYDFIFNEVRKKVTQLFVEPNELWKALWNAFDISIVNKNFYNDIKNYFTKLAESPLLKSCIRNEEERKQFAVRLIGRIIFCWFLKKKGIIENETLSSLAVRKYDNFYLEFLEKLFFEVFNTPKEERKTVPPEIKDYPFLNGGLFEDQPGDFKGNVIIENEWFQDLFAGTLEKYNFTIDENTSSNAEIAIDPEMLGRIFENLLAEQNPETHESARRSTGSYYTPREIVDYMVEQSISEYLKTQIITDDIARNETSKQSLENTIEEFVHTEELPEALEPYKKDIFNKLNSVKVLDPACGSGAFPMGMLQKLMALKFKTITLKPSAERKRDEKADYSENIYNLKLQTILNSIYGCDIQPMAVELSRLRCWLSLIIDEEVDKKKENWGVEPLPNFEFKFVCCNSLIGLDDKEKSTGDAFDTEYEKIILFREKLKETRKKFFGAKTKEHKNELRELDRKIFIELLQLIKEQKRKAVITQAILSFKPYDVNNVAEFFEPEWMFGFNDGFDIVIGNPPYIQLQKSISNTSKLKFADLYKDQKYETFERTGDIYCLFDERGINLLKENGHLCYITSNKWMRAGYGESLRKYFIKYNPKILIDLGPGVFESATVDTNILLIQKTKSKTWDQSANLRAVTISKEENVDIQKQLNENGIVLTKLSKDAWFIGNSEEQKLKEKIERIGKPLKDWDVNIYRGILTGLNEAFIITTEKRNEILAECKDNEERNRTESIIKPILRGRDIKRYYYEWAGLWVIVIPAGWTKNVIKAYFSDERTEKEITKIFPSLMNHLFPFKSKAQKRDDQGDFWWELRHCAYYPEFEKEKVVYSEIVRQPQFYFDKEKFYVEATSFLMTGKNVKYLCGLLNSNAVTYLFKNWYAGGGLGEEGYRYKKAFLENLPFPPIASSNQPIISQIELLVEQILTAKKANPQANTKHLEDQIDIMVYKLYNLSYAEVKIIDPEIENVISKEDYEKREFK